jgi:hypothetical protein
MNGPSTHKSTGSKGERAIWQGLKQCREGREPGGEEKLTTQIGKARQDRGFLVFVDPNRNARVRGKERWGYDHCNKREGKPKIAHLYFTLTCTGIPFSRARLVSVTGLRELKGRTL